MVFSTCPLLTFDDQQEPIKHEVRVEMMLIPAFAVDERGNPVYDLKEEDFQLYVDNEPVKLAGFFRHTFTEESLVKEEITKKAAPSRTPPLEQMQTQRFIFIILDTVYSSHRGFRRAKKIVEGIIENAAPSDQLVILENLAIGGLKYVDGPKKDRKELIQRVEKLKIPSRQWGKTLFFTRQWNPDADTDAYDPRSNMGKAGVSRQLDKFNYKLQLKHFADSLRRFKYALKTISQPKVVFLVSEGMARGSFLMKSQTEGNLVFALPGHSTEVSRPAYNDMAILKDEASVKERKEYFDVVSLQYLQRALHAINNSGTVLYTINPAPFEKDRDASGEMSLRYMASEGGGKYIAGADTKEVIERVVTSTSAYYELAFVAPEWMGGNLDIRLECKRKGVTINTFDKTQRARPYRVMTPMQKKLFALNMVTGGSWSRLLGKVVRVKYNITNKKQVADEVVNNIDVELPHKMRNVKLDLFLINYNPVTKKTVVEIVRDTQAEKANLVLKRTKDTQSYFVIIEPRNVYSIYNRVI